MVVHHQASPSDVTDFMEARRLFSETVDNHEMIELGENSGKIQESFDFDAPTDSKSKAKGTPIPKAQLAVLCAVRLVDPIAFTQIFPYVNEMMEHLHLTNDPNKIGFYSGVVVSELAYTTSIQLILVPQSLSQESSFSIAQLLTIYHWARISGAYFIGFTLSITPTSCFR